MSLSFAVYYRRGSAWVQGKSIFEQPLAEHLAYMKTLRAKGMLLMGGPFTDDAGGLLIVRAENQQEANAIPENDPAVQAGIMTAEAHPWKLLAGQDILTEMLAVS